MVLRELKAAKLYRGASGARLSIKIGSATNNVISSAKLFIGINPTFKSSSPIKASGSTTKRVGFAKLFRPNGKKAKSVLPRQGALEPATRQLTIVPPTIRLLAIAPTVLEYILEILKSVESNIDLNIDLNNLDS
ncbi:hypothetical protein V2W45_1326380 [Cenococcum geophilum]